MFHKIRHIDIIFFYTNYNIPSIIMKMYIGLLLISIMFITIILNPYEKKENFESSIITNLKSNYRKNKRKAKMIKDGFTSNMKYKVKHFVRKNNL